jgi:hypothetical protein
MIFSFREKTEYHDKSNKTGHNDHAAIPALRELRLDFKASLCYIARPYF